MFLLICNVTKNRQTLFLSIQLSHNVNFLNKLSKKVLPLYKLEMELWLGFIIKFLKKRFLNTQRNKCVGQPILWRQHIRTGGT